jgi:hypothetical protein
MERRRTHRRYPHKLQQTAVSTAASLQLGVLTFKGVLPMRYCHTPFVVLFMIIVPFCSLYCTGKDKPVQPYIDQQPVSSQVSQPDSAAVARDAQQLRDVIGRVNNILFRGTGLQRITGQTADGAFIVGFDADTVIRIINEGKETLNAGLEKKEFAGLRAYVTEFYKVPTYESLELAGRTVDAQTLITPQAKDDAFANPRRVVEKIESVANESRLAINLRVNSQPEELAKYEMWPDQGQTRTTVTNNTLDGVYRGYYSYRVTKPGYKKIEDKLNLVDSDGRTLDCTLNKTDDSDGPSPCKHH